ncbi:MAG: enoyl-CoA hydratase/isomerase family protein [Acidimicrobiia bacterium]
MPSIQVTATEFADLLRSPFVHEELTTASGVDAVVVRGDLSSISVEPDGLPTCPVIAVGPAAPWADVVIATRNIVLPGAIAPAIVGSDGEDVLARLLVSIEANPIAATSLAVLLRTDGGRDIAEGLAAESAVYSLLQAGPEFARWRATGAHRPPGPDPEPAVLAERTDDLVHITLNRPHRHNAFSASLRDALVAQLAVAALDGSVRVIVDGAGPSFCSGGDLGEFGSFPDPANAHVVRLARSAARLMASMSERVEVRLHGACMGAGIELPAFAGRVTAAPDAVIALPEIGLGLIPGAGGTASIPRRIGRQRTAWLGLSGEPIDAATALGWGLIDEIAAP